MTSSRLLLKWLLALAGVASGAAATIAGSADYVVVGGGPAGFVLAEQLSRNPHTQVVLLEAGPDGINSSLINSGSPMHARRTQELY